MYFGKTEEELIQNKSSNTAKEILQQPKLWLETIEIIEKNREELNNYFNKIVLDSDTKIIFTGAGTSEYVGNILSPLIKENTNYDVESIATTDILSNPFKYLKKDKKTLVVSFARSGDSPESLGVVSMLDDMLDNVNHLFITCNKQGGLAKRSTEKNNIFLLLMPEESNDKGFAMTSSFSCMLLSGILSFIQQIEISELKRFIEISNIELNEKYEEIKKIAEEDHKRIVVLGSGILKGLAEELSLKIMELSAGKVVSTSNTPLGFRHGPKAIVNKETIIFNLINEDQYSKQYDEDLLEEMYGDETRGTLISYCIISTDKINNNSDKVMTIKNVGILKDDKLHLELISLLVYLVYGQMYAYFKSLYLECSTDNPFPTGEVNRVVKRFTVHKLKK